MAKKEDSRVGAVCRLCKWSERGLYGLAEPIRVLSWISIRPHLEELVPWKPTFFFFFLNLCPVSIFPGYTMAVWTHLRCFPEQWLLLSPSVG